jgi:hypothetical protein
MIDLAIDANPTATGHHSSPCLNLPYIASILEHTIQMHMHSHRLSVDRDRNVLGFFAIVLRFKLEARGHSRLEKR